MAYLGTRLTVIDVKVDIVVHKVDIFICLSSVLLPNHLQRRVTSVQKEVHVSE